MRLHTIWDECLGGSDSHLAITFIADQITNDPTLTESQLTELKAHTTFDSWAIESYQWAVAMAHMNGRLRSASWQAHESKKISEADVPALWPSYLPNVRELSRRRVALAGRRLATTIAAALDVTH
jgi:hypothetical protein